uniref:Uncharacterized protein n=1 Tax=Anopheles quadriannulatus TaxID=34691 RepID=A0A182XTU2_ANOQN
RNQEAELLPEHTIPTRRLLIVSPTKCTNHIRSSSKFRKKQATSSTISKEERIPNPHFTIPLHLMMILDTWEPARRDGKRRENHTNDGHNITNR